MELGGLGREERIEHGSSTLKKASDELEIVQMHIPTEAVAILIHQNILKFVGSKCGEQSVA